MGHIEILFLCFAVVISPLLASKYPIVEIPERVDDEGFKWVGPVRLFSLPATKAERNAWMAETIERLTPKIAKGFPEYGFPVIDPFSLKTFDYSQKVGPVKINLAAKNIEIIGISKFKQAKLTVDKETNTICYFIIEVPEISLSATYKASGTAVLFPITGAGPAHVKINNVRATGYMNLTVVAREDGVDVVQVAKTVIKDLKFERAHVQVQGLFDGNPILSAAVHYFANSYGPQLFDAVVKDKVSPRIAELFTNDVMNPFFYNLPQFALYISNLEVYNP